MDLFIGAKIMPNENVSTLFFCLNCPIYNQICQIFYFIILLMHKQSRKLSAKCLNKYKETKPKIYQNQILKQSPWESNNSQGYQAYMKYLIASNAEYYQSKVCAKQVGKPKDVQFKMPSQTGVTIYKKDFKRKQNKFNFQTGIKRDMSVDCIKTNDFLKDQQISLAVDGKTTYQQEFKYHNLNTEHHGRFKKRVEPHEKENQDVPRFLQTQNRIDFLNWAGKNYVPSMKPEPKSAAINLPFQAKSIYQSDFKGKSHLPTPLFVRKSSFPKFSSLAQMMKSSYSNDFISKRRELIQIDCKPKNTQVSLCKHLKGTTQYKREFTKISNYDENDKNGAPTLQQMQTLIIDL